MSSEDREGIPLGLLSHPRPSRGGTEVRLKPIRPFRSIRFRVLATVLTTLTALTGALVTLMLSQQQILQAQSMIDEAYLPLVLKLDESKTGWNRVDNDIRRLLDAERRPTTGGNVSLTSFYSQQLINTLQECRKFAWQARVRAASGPEVAVVHQLDNYLNDADVLAVTWRQKAIDLVQHLESGDQDGAAELQGAFRYDAGRLEDTLSRLANFVRGRMTSLRGQARQQRNQANTIAFALTALALGLSVVMTWTVSSAVSSVGRLTTEVQRLAEGEYGGLVEVSGQDEVGLLANEYNRMVRSLAVRDATLVRRAEQLNRLSRYLANVLDSLQDGLFVVEHGVVTIANPAAEAQWQVQREGPPPKTVRPFLEAPGLSEHRLGSRHVEVRVMPFGEAGFIVLTTDVTEQRRALDQLARSERLAQMGQMLAQITHEVRNPLNAMSLNAEMLTDELGTLDPERSSEAWALLDTVSGEIERLTQVTAHYLQLARRSPAQLVPTDLAGLLEDVLRLLDAELRQADVTLETAFEPVEPQLADGNQLRQAILNLIRNAAEAGAHHLQLRLRLVDDEVRIELRDDGPGMDDEEIDRAFDPFFSTKASGTGLGLAITQQILEDHGGEIRAESVKGQGTTVVLALPAAPLGTPSLTKSPLSQGT
ncbi:MAG: ATP-binding protein [Myxococcota bacterium]